MLTRRTVAVLRHGARLAPAAGPAVRRRCMCTRPPADLAAQLAADPARLRAVMEALPPDARRAAGLSRALAELEDEFTKADINADGTLSFSEFRSWAETLQTDGPRPADAPATAAQLRALFRLTFAPYVGFGLCDNALMICSGEAIDASIGVAFGLSTLAAAALGNALSNGTGMVLHGTIERCAAALGLSDPRLTPKQARNRSSRPVRNVKMAAGILGVLTGCVLGMFPLLFIDAPKSDRAERDGEGPA